MRAALAPHHHPTPHAAALAAQDIGVCDMATMLAGRYSSFRGRRGVKGDGDGRLSELRVRCAALRDRLRPSRQAGGGTRWASLHGLSSVMAHDTSSVNKEVQQPSKVAEQLIYRQQRSNFGLARSLSGGSTGGERSPGGFGLRRRRTGGERTIYRRTGSGRWSRAGGGTGVTPEPSEREISGELSFNSVDSRGGDSAHGGGRADSMSWGGAAAGVSALCLPSFLDELVTGHFGGNTQPVHTAATRMQSAVRGTLTRQRSRSTLQCRGTPSTDGGGGVLSQTCVTVCSPGSGDHSGHTGGGGGGGDDGGRGGALYGRQIQMDARAMLAHAPAAERATSTPAQQQMDIGGFVGQVLDKLGWSGVPCDPRAPNAYEPNYSPGCATPVTTATRGRESPSIEAQRAAAAWSRAQGSPTASGPGPRDNAASRMGRVSFEPSHPR